MIVTIVQIDEALQLVPLASDAAARAWQDAEARVWVDIEGSTPAELASWLDAVGVDGLARQLCLEAPDRPGFYPLKRETIVILPVLPGTESEARCHLFLCRESLLLTLDAGVARGPVGGDTLQDLETWLPGRSVAGLASVLLMNLSQAGLRRTRALRASIRSLEEQMDRDPDVVPVDTVTDLRGELLPMTAAVSDWLPAVQALSTTARAHFHLEDAGEYLHCALANLQAAHTELERLDAHLDAVHAAFQMHGQDKTNRRLGVLAVLSAIFMPITLLAAIWGMNFATMPELHYRFGYPMALGLMAAIAIGMYLFFRRRGWFD